MADATLESASEVSANVALVRREFGRWRDLGRAGTMPFMKPLCMADWDLQVCKWRNFDELYTTALPVSLMYRPQGEGNLVETGVGYMIHELHTGPATPILGAMLPAEMRERGVFSIIVSYIRAMKLANIADVGACFIFEGSFGFAAAAIPPWRWEDPSFLAYWTRTQAGKGCARVRKEIPLQMLFRDFT